MDARSSNVNINTFMAHGAPAISSAFESAVVKFTPPNPTPRIVKRSSKFKEFFKQFVDRSDKPELKSFQIERHFQLADVLREANGAIEEYEKQGSSWRHHFVRTAGRSFTNNASTTEVLLQFIPDGEYTFLICGALTCVYNAAKRYSKVRERILGCLAGLARVVDRTELYMRVYAGNQKLWLAAEDLYLALLDAVQEMTIWLDKKAYKKAFEVLFKQTDYGKPLEDKITKLIDETVGRFHELVDYCQHERIQEVHEQGNEIRLDVKEIKSLQEDVVRMAVAVVSAMGQQHNWHMEQRLQIQQEHQQTQEALHRLAGQQQNTFITIAQPIVDCYKLMNILGAGFDMCARETSAALQSGQCMTPSRQARAAALMQHPQFEYWAKTGRSMALVVNGRESRSTQGIMSSLTYFAALFSQTLSGMQVALPLLYICGRHATPGDELEGASGMMRALISQVLAHYGNRLDLSFLTYDYLEAVKSQDINCLCHLFRSLLISVITSGSYSGTTADQRAIICILDGVSFLETDARVDDLQIAIDCLQRVVMEVDALGGFFIFKLVLLFPMMSRYAGEWFPEETILTMRDEIAGDGHAYGQLRMAAVSESLWAQ